MKVLSSPSNQTTIKLCYSPWLVPPAEHPISLPIIPETHYGDICMIVLLVFFHPSATSKHASSFSLVVHYLGKQVIA